MQSTLTRAPAGRSLIASVDTFVNFWNGIQKLVIVEPSTGGGGGGGGGGVGGGVTVMPTDTSLLFPSPSLTW